MSDELYDVAVVGAGPSGATAANLLAEAGHRVVMIDGATFPREVTRASWFSAAGLPLLEEVGARVKSLKRGAFRSVTFYNADFSATAMPSFEEAPGYLVDRAEFDNALVKAAVKKEVTFLQGCAVTDLALNEPSVSLRLADGRSVEAKLLMLASGRGTALLDRVGLAVGRAGTTVFSAQVLAPSKRSSAPPEPRVGVVLGLDPAGSFAMCCVGLDRVSITINWMGDPGDALAMLVHVCRLAHEHGAVPVDLSPQAASATLFQTPASAALDMDSHVGKHTLVIGEAGGFVSAASNEGIYPAMWSAKMGVEVADRALACRHSQDELMTFNTVWRMQMADYLRSPHTDIQFLLPLIFTNQPMADRMGAAFFRGENI